jgi:hypothetical protein
VLPFITKVEDGLCEIRDYPCLNLKFLKLEMYSTIVSKKLALHLLGMAVGIVIVLVCEM